MGSVALPQGSSIRTTRSFVGDRELLAAGVLVLATNEVGDLLVLGLLNGALVVLLALTEEVLLNIVDACKGESVIVRLASQDRLAYPCPGSPPSSLRPRHRLPRC
jgi:hypothetical protein